MATVKKNEDAKVDLTEEKKPQTKRATRKKTVEHPVLLNKVEGFNPWELIEDVKNPETGEVYEDDNGNVFKFIPPKAKIAWFRMMYPLGSITTTRIPTKNPYSAFYRAEIKFDAGQEFPNATSDYEITAASSDENGMRKAIKKAQLIAVSEALSMAGFGCEVEAMLRIDTEDTDGFSHETSTDKKSEKPEKEALEIENDKKEEPVDAELEDIFTEIDESFEDKKVEPEVETEPEKEKVEPKKEKVKPEIKEEDKLEAALNTVIKTTDKAQMAISQHEGRTIKEVMDETSDFCKVLVRKRIKEQVVPEVVEAAQIILKSQEK